MKDVCIRAVSQAAGRALNQQELKNIIDRIAENRQQLARTDNAAYVAMSPDMQLQQAAKLAAQQIIGDAQKAKQRVALKIIRHDAIDNYLTSQKTKGLGGMDSLKRLLAFVADGKSDNQSIETKGKSIATDYIRQLVDAFESAEPKIFGLFTNNDGIKALTYELFGQDSRGIVPADVSATAKKAAKAWQETADSMRKSYNAAGGDIGQIDDWRMPQSHSQKRVADAGQNKWVNNIFSKVDRKKYVNADGSYMDDAQLVDFLKEAWVTISTGGANKIEPGKIMGVGMMANRHAEQRSIHFADAESYIEYQQAYGSADAYSTMMGHIQSLSKDMATLEILGPNPNQMLKYFLDREKKADSINNPSKSGAVEGESVYLQKLYNIVTGVSDPIASRKIAEGFDTLRNWLVATKLGSAAITSISDNATMQLTASVNNMSHMKLMRNQLKSLNFANKDELRMARRAGLSLDTFIGEVNRWGQDNLGLSFSKKAANLTMRLSGLNAMTEGRRRAFGVTMYGSIGNVTRKAATLEHLDVTDRKILQSKGINETDFQVWKKAGLEKWDDTNDSMLTPESIYSIPDSELAALGNPSRLRREAALKLIGMVDEEINMAIIQPGAIDRMRSGSQFQKGTWSGEIARSFFLFKGMPLALVTRHFARGMNMGTAGGKAAYIAALVASTTILGAAAVQINNMVSGKNPQDMTNWKFWASAFTKGGSLGIYGDFVFNLNTQYGSSPLGVLAGPVAGYVEDMVNLTQGNMIKYAKGEKTHAGADAIRILKGNIPLNNLWYTKAVTDRLVFNQLQELVSPGYMKRVERRAKKEFNQNYYWPPMNIAPKSLPDISHIAGQ